jgi:glycosyltransferase involved in cell wall biosynthesis
VSVVGGDQGAMRAELPAGVTLLPAATTREAVHSLRRLGPHDVMHAHMTAAELACVVIKPAVGGRLVATRHFAARRGSSAPGRVIAPLLARAIDQQVAISDFVASEMDGDGLVVHNGVRPSVAATPRQPTVVVLQRLEMEKQTDVALRAWAASGLADRGWRMVVHGRGAQQPALERLRAELGVTASVTLEGFTNAPRVALAAASVLLATAPGEPFGLTVAEAMAEGTPVVAADGGAHRELLGDLGYYFPPGDAQAAAEALLEAVALDDGDRSRLADDLRERQAAHFSVHRQVDGLFEAYRPPPRIAVLSLETWDGVWRRNQHVASRVVDTGAASSLLFVTPPHGGLAVRARRWSPQPGIEVVTPPLLVPRSRGGHRILARWLRHATRDVDLIWVNDPVAGATCLRPDVPVLYDVTDDWRRMDQPARDRARIVAAEDRLARSAETVVCSPWLADRWLERYGVEATLIGNGVDARAIRNAVPMETSTPGPHVVYVGTLHPNRIDVDLLVDLAEQGPGTLHLVGPESLGGSTRARLAAAGAALHGPVRSTDVPRWLAIADVLVCPHRVDDFTLSLDAIKAYEYLATNTPVVATPSSGFQDLTSPGLSVVTADKFVDAVAAAVGSGPFYRRMPVDWDDRAADFSAVVRRCASQDRRRSR